MNETPVVKIDLHCHSEASSDCVTPLEQIAKRCIARGINVQAITDHNQIWGAVKLREIVENNPEYKDLTIIIGEEVSTNEGEIIGLFLEERIAPGMSAMETVEAIKAQNGLVYLPHGFDPLKRHRLKPLVREQIAAHIDIVESFNARVSRIKWNDAASLWAVERGIAQAAGSDAHTSKDVGCAWTETVPGPIFTPDDLLLALKQSKIQGIWTHPVVAFYHKAVYYVKKKLRFK